MMFHNQQLEEAIIGGLLLNGDKAVSLASWKSLHVEDFFSYHTSEIFMAIKDLLKDGKPTDPVTVQNILLQKGVLDKVGGTMMLERCADACGSWTSIAAYIDELKDLLAKQELSGLLEQANNELTSGRSFEEVTSQISSFVDKKASSRLTVETNKTQIKQLLNRVNISDDVVMSRYPAISAKLGGYKRGKVCTLAARPSIGKTMFALNEARHIADRGEAVGIVSLETDVEEIYAMMAAEEAGINLFRRRLGRLPDVDEKAFQESLQHVLDLPIVVSDKSMDADHVANWIYLMANKYKLSLVIVDYFQIIGVPPGMRGPNRESYNYAMHKLFDAARKSNVAMLLLAQLTRASEVPPGVKDADRMKYVPSLVHLKETSMLEEASYQAILMYPDLMLTDPDSELVLQTNFKIAKNKMGGRGTIQLTFMKERQRFEN